MPDDRAPSMLLSDAELAALTRRDRPAAQARVLRALGVPFKPHPTDGVLLVSRAAAEAAMGAPVRAIEAGSSAGVVWDLNMQEVPKRGKAKAAH